jgi:CRP/FNR family cyclic AMP-dependent transcriptional regulator
MPPSFIQQTPFFDGLPEVALAEIAANSRTAEFAAGHIVVRAGDAPKYLMIVLRGTCQLNDVAEDGRIIGISSARPNDVLAWLSVIDNKPTAQMIVCTNDCTMLICPASVIQNLITKHSLLAQRFLQMSADSIRRLEQGRALLSLPNAFHRVFVQINLLSSDAETGLTNLPKQRDIASAVNTSRETVSRALKLLIKNGVLNKAGNNIVIKQADTLKRLAIDGLEAIPME